MTFPSGKLFSVCLPIAVLVKPHAFPKYSPMSASLSNTESFYHIFFFLSVIPPLLLYATLII